MRVLVTALLASLPFASPLSGQPRPSVPDTTAVVVPRWLAGVAADIGQPVGTFRQNVKQAAGVQGHVLLRLDRHGRAAIRLQGGWLNYGHESQRICLASTPGCRVAANVTTANGILSWGVGPQLSLPLGPVRVFGYGLVGVSRVATVSGIGGGLVPDIVAGDENFGDSGLSWSSGVGLQLPVRRSSSIDVGVAYQGNGRRSYLLSGGVTDNADGSLAFDIRRSNADLFAIRAGVTSVIPWGRRKSTP
jgi:hypothetical protein